jgi:hypothetical protein
VTDGAEHGSQSSQKSSRLRSRLRKHTESMRVWRRSVERKSGIENSFVLEPHQLECRRGAPTQGAKDPYRQVSGNRNQSEVNWHHRGRIIATYSLWWRTKKQKNEKRERRMLCCKRRIKECSKRFRQSKPRTYQPKNLARDETMR